MTTEIRATLHQVGPTTTEGQIRHHKVLVDRPTAKGGHDRGPMGGELFLAAVGGCFMSNLLAAIIAREAPVTGAGVEVVGVLVDAPTRYQAIELRVSGECADRELLRKLVDIADRGCIMTNTLRHALDLRVRLIEPNVPSTPA